MLALILCFSLHNFRLSVLKIVYPVATMMALNPDFLIDESDLNLKTNFDFFDPSVNPDGI